MSVVAIAGKKGGIGKSTIAGNLAGEFHAMGRKVILLDADPQHSLVDWAGQGDGLLSKCVRRVDKHGIEDLAAIVKSAQKEADFILIDTPPGLPDIAQQAALVADLVLLPCGPSPLDLFAVKAALAEVLKVRGKRKSKKPRIRLVPSKIMVQTNLGRSLPGQLEALGKKILPAIGQRVTLAECVLSGLTVGEYAPESAAHQEFIELARAVSEVLQH